MHRFTSRLHHALSSAARTALQQSRLLPSLRPSATQSSQISSLHPRHRIPFSSQSSWPAPAARGRTRSQRTDRVSRGGYAYFGGGPRGGSNGTSPTTRYVIMISGVGIGIYIFSNIDHAPFTGRTRIMGVSRKQELALGASAYQDVLNSFQGRLLPVQHPESQRVRKVVSKLAGTVRQIDPNLSEGFAWQIVVAAEDEPNALCVPGGRILITTGILRILPTDDDLAVVLAHEIAHALNRHGAESMHLQRMLMPLLFFINQVLDMRWIPSVLVTLLLSLPYSRKLEYEADEVGLHLCAEACFDPRVAPDVFKRLGALQNEKGGSRMASFLSTHPQSKERAARLQASVPAKAERYNDRCTVTSSFPQFVRDYPDYSF